MITAGHVTCIVPTPAAAKLETLSCTIPDINTADVYTAIGTIVLAVFAIAAWWSSRRTLKEMQLQTRQQAATARQQLERAALADYLEILGELTASKDPLALRAKYQAELGTWRLYLDDRDPMVQLIRQVAALVPDAMIETFKAMSKDPTPRTANHEPSPSAMKYSESTNSAWLLTESIVAWRGQTSESDAVEQHLCILRERLVATVQGAELKEHGELKYWANMSPYAAPNLQNAMYVSLPGPRWNRK